MVVQTEEAVDIYRQLANVPLPTSAKLGNVATAGHVVVQSVWEQRDLEKKEKVIYKRMHMVHLDMSFELQPEVISKVSWRVESPSGKYCAILRNKQEKDEEQQFIEIWTSKSLRNTIKVADIKQHGRIFGNDDQFGCFEWNTAETHLLYVAEKKQPKHKSFFDNMENETGDFQHQDRVCKGEEYTYKEHWGEQMTKCFKPVLCALDIDSAVPSVLENIPEDVSPGQAVWSPGDLGIICVGWVEQPYHLGLVYCPNRRNTLYFIDLSNFTCTTLLPPDLEVSVRSPVLSPDQSKLVFLMNNAGGPHAQCSSLHMIDWATKGVVPVVDRVGKATGQDFPGIFTSRLPKRCWTSDSNNVLMSTFWRSKEEIISVSIDSGKVSRLTNDSSVGSWTLFDVHNDLLVASCSSPTVCPYLVMGQFNDLKHNRPKTWTALDGIPESSPHMEYQFLHVDVPVERCHPQFKDLDYECILVHPTQTPSCKVPLIVFPHGGPHSVHIADFHRYIAGFCLCGFAVLEINYRGSLGFGQDGVDSLPGRIGDQDVKDCQAAVEHVLAIHPHIVDHQNIVVFGGSHGGFLVAHLIGQYPSFYKAAVARNPVINLAAMLNVTDIPDWCRVEAGAKFDFSCTSDSKVYEEMWKKSPIQYIDQVKTPVMLMVGQDDLRVPPSQAMEYRRALKARGAVVEMKSYPGNSHPIEKVESEADAFVNIISWFNKHLSKHIHHIHPHAPVVDS